MENKRNNALKKSIGNSIKIEVNGRKYVMKKSTFNKYALAFILIISMATIAISKLVGNAIDQTKLYNYTEPQRIEVNKNSHTKIDDEGNPVPWYDTSGIAIYLLEEGANDFDQNFYGIYLNIGGYGETSRIKNTNEILSDANDIIKLHPEYGFKSGYKNFDEYLIANGFVDKEGKPSVEQYEAYMAAVTIAKDENNTDDFKM